MAKNWTYSNEAKGILTRSYKDETPSLVLEITDLYPDFMEFDEPQELYIVNGIKQKLDDAIARGKEVKLTESEKREVQEIIWLRATVERKYNAEGKERGPMVSLNKAVVGLAEAGLTVEVIAQTLGKKLEDVQSILDK